MARGAGGKNEFLRSSKIMSRQSSMSLSSRIYYRSSGAAGFPFTWEMLPGEPKDKPANDGEIPPLSPPPALMSLSLPKPSVDDYFENKKSSKPSKLLLKLWKKMGKKIKNKKSQNKTLYISSDQCGDNDVDLDTLFDEVELGSSVDSSSYSTPPRKAMSNSSCSLSPCSSSSSTMEDKNSKVARADEDVSSRKPFSWSISRMVVACGSGSKRV